MSRWAYSMTRFTVRELDRMRRGAYPYNRRADAERSNATGSPWRSEAPTWLSILACFTLAMGLCALYVGFSG